MTLTAPYVPDTLTDEDLSEAVAYPLARDYRTREQKKTEPYPGPTVGVLAVSDSDTLTAEWQAMRDAVELGERYVLAFPDRPDLADKHNEGTRRLRADFDSLCAEVSADYDLVVVDDLSDRETAHYRGEEMDVDDILRLFEDVIGSVYWIHHYGRLSAPTADVPTVAVENMNYLPDALVRVMEQADDYELDWAENWTSDEGDTWYRTDGYSRRDYETAGGMIYGHQYLDPKDDDYDEDDARAYLDAVLADGGAFNVPSFLDFDALGFTPIHRDELDGWRVRRYGLPDDRKNDGFVYIVDDADDAYRRPE